jgi:hypothetical protein
LELLDWLLELDDEVLLELLDWLEEELLVEELLDVLLKLEGGLELDVLDDDPLLDEISPPPVNAGPWFLML